MIRYMQLSVTPAEKASEKVVESGRSLSKILAYVGRQPTSEAYLLSE